MQSYQIACEYLVSPDGRSVAHVLPSVLLVAFVHGLVGLHDGVLLLAAPAEEENHDEACWEHDDSGDKTDENLYTVNMA